MTSRDIMPIGKYKGQPLAKVDKGYINWFLQQEWAEEKYPDLFEYFSSGSVPNQSEQAIIDEEQKLILSMPTAFAEWWRRVYGERLRKSGPMLYIGYLRVAIEAWSAAEAGLAGLKRNVPVSEALVRSAQAGPADVFSQPLNKVEEPIDF